VGLDLEDREDREDREDQEDPEGLEKRSRSHTKCDAI